MPFLFAKYFFCSNKRFYYEDEKFKFEKKGKTDACLLFNNIAKFAYEKNFPDSFKSGFCIFLNPEFSGENTLPSINFSFFSAQARGNV